MRKATPESYWRDGLSSSNIKTCWGAVEVKVQRLKAKTGKGKQMYYDATLDESGFSPAALERILDLAARLPFEEAAVVANNFDLKISRSQICELSSPYAKSAQRCVQQYLNEVAQEAVAAPGDKQVTAQFKQEPGRLMILQLDGVCVLGQPEDGRCPGLEIKTAVLYPQSNPNQRWMIAERCSVDAFLSLLVGLLQEAKVKATDTLIGLGDGASWIEKCFDYLQATHITDVFHACDYLDTIMQALQWDEAIRLRHRCSWYRGEVNARAWLKEHLPEPEVWLGWDEKALKALSYLDSRLESMNYAHFAQQGYPIGSGQVEAMNKAVIGHRLKRSGMHWSTSGARSMAALRAQVCAKHPLVHFDQLRFQAFPVPCLSP